MSASEVEARRLLAVALVDLPYDAETLMAVIIEYRRAMQTLLDDTAGMRKDAARLAEIRAVFDVFDWETDDRQMALEQIEEIVRGQS